VSAGGGATTALAVASAVVDVASATGTVVDSVGGAPTLCASPHARHQRSDRLEHPSAESLGIMLPRGMNRRTMLSPTKPWPSPQIVGDRLPFLRTAVVALLFASTQAGCLVWKDDYTKAVADLQFERNRTQDMEKKLLAAKAEITRLGEEIAARDKALQEANVKAADLTRQLEELTVLNMAMQDRLKAAGQGLDQLSGEKGALAAQLAETKKQLEELKKQQAAAEARVAQFNDLIARFKKLADAGKLKVVLRQGRMLIELPSDVLFDSGKAEINQAGKATVQEVGKVLAGMPDRRFQVAGHTDNVKIQTARFASNWELSTARGVDVLKVLVAAKVKPGNLSAAGYGEFDPVAANDTTENKQKNRRIEITLVPNLEEFVKMPEKK
jgi:chemotaxis protein MotB